MPRKEEEEAQHCTKADKKKMSGRVISCRTLHNKAGSAADTLYSPCLAASVGSPEETEMHLPPDRPTGMLVVRVASFVKLYFFLFYFCVRGGVSFMQLCFCSLAAAVSLRLVTFLSHDCVAKQMLKEALCLYVYSSGCNHLHGHFWRYFVKCGPGVLKRKGPPPKELDHEKPQGLGTQF